ncbi:protein DETOXIFICATION 43-like [Humulus lupulus]|uniref:protein DETOXIFICATION 43-like n=1 Tax=Humulus lupulus TaxID=3486 RepID=UPI002B402132|nr:protein DETOXIFICATION 43-like [Humulus lupulus]
MLLFSERNYGLFKADGTISYDIGFHGLDSSSADSLCLSPKDSPMLAPAEKYLVTRAFGAPAVLLTLAMQGIFRGFKDTTTPLYVILLGYSLNVALDPLLIFVCHLGIRGAAIAHVLSQMKAFTIQVKLLLSILMDVLQTLLLEGYLYQ